MPQSQPPPSSPQNLQNSRNSTGLPDHGCGTSPVISNPVPITDSTAKQSAGRPTTPSRRNPPSPTNSNKVRNFTRPARFRGRRCTPTAKYPVPDASAQPSIHAIPLEYKPFNGYLFLSIG